MVMLCFLVLTTSARQVGLVLFVQLLMLLMFVSGLTQMDCWSRWYFHWPASAGDLGVGGVSFVELLILYE